MLPNRTSNLQKFKKPAVAKVVKAQDPEKQRLKTLAKQEEWNRTRLGLGLNKK
jgi:hypothetical protein